MTKKLPNNQNDSVENQLSEGLEKVAKCGNTKATLVFLLMFVLGNPAIKLVEKTKAQLANALETVEKLDIWEIWEDAKTKVLELVENGLSLLWPKEAIAGSLDDLMKKTAADKAATSDEIKKQQEENARREQRIKDIERRNNELKLELIELEKEYTRLKQDNERLKAINEQALKELEIMININKKRTYVNSVFLKWKNSSKSEINIGIDYVKYVLANLNVFSQEKQQKFRPTLQEILTYLESINKQ